MTRKTGRSGSAMTRKTGRSGRSAGVYREAPAAVEEYRPKHLQQWAIGPFPYAVRVGEPWKVGSGRDAVEEIAARAFVAGKLRRLYRGTTALVFLASKHELFVFRVIQDPHDLVVQRVGRERTVGQAHMSDLIYKYEQKEGLALHAGDHWLRIKGRATGRAPGRVAGRAVWNVQRDARAESLFAKGRLVRLVELPISKIDFTDYADPEFEERARDPKGGPAYVRSLAKSMRDGAPMPPAIGYKLGGYYVAHDGNHRISAAKMLGMKKVPFIVYSTS